MDRKDILRWRLQRTRLTKPAATTPAETVRWLTAVQAQDYTGAKWGVGQRIARASDALLEQAFETGAILRTHLMRATWHFVSPEDIRWLLGLTAPRVIANSRPYYQQTELDEKDLAKSRAVLEKALAGGNYLTREEIAQALAAAKIKASGLKLALLVMRAELDAVICSGPRRGKQFTYALLDERAPKAKPLAREAALAELTRRYFESHGPATAHDFAWWSGLNVSDAKRGVELLGKKLSQASLDGKTYVFSEPNFARRTTKSEVWLLPNYDEYMVAYKDRGEALAVAQQSKDFARERVLFLNIVVRDGLVVGSFRRANTKQKLTLEVALLDRFDAEAIAALERAAERYASFLDLPLELRVKQVAGGAASTTLPQPRPRKGRS
ncbi:MAG: winged helix DNA-binding domain-containing protein [Myxococcota bacterium]